MLSASDRRRRILDAAEALFTAKGYGDTSMDDIAKACGMSKKTLYAVFADKATLFSSLIADNEAFPILAYEGGQAVADTRAALTDVLSGLVDFILMPRQVAMTRLAICETLHAPELSQQFFTAALDRGEGYLRDALTRVFPAWNARTIQPLLPIIVGAALGGLQLRALVEPGKLPDRRTRRRNIALCVAMVWPLLSRPPGAAD
ncbi:TetR/AcrR family transcriptional regulator [Pigmentiphaga litoralis]|uniref:TetR/AcrR family transcriptional regulator n=1 Tax=Pigmentiphaga litoralis TaxID=516702 RepID=UPI0016798C98|nr:TetR/AcrR family transcriptional regulator [Pigmentiphaga litoralis]